MQRDSAVQYVLSLGRFFPGEPVVVMVEVLNDLRGAIGFRTVGAACGCTAMEIPQSPVEPGETALLPVVFDLADRIDPSSETVSYELTSGAVREVLTGSMDHQGSMSSSKNGQSCSPPARYRCTVSSPSVSRASTQSQWLGPGSRPVRTWTQYVQLAGLGRSDVISTLSFAITHLMQPAVDVNSPRGSRAPLSAPVPAELTDEAATGNTSLRRIRENACWEV
ncbi:MAG: DUF1573 domain-containing protein [Candidatus Sumerlaeia bacterium]|nr:DUF1573 domain-containing protein [Candidatus Sumerlaeia bacterium]